MAPGNIRSDSNQGAADTLLGLLGLEQVGKKIDQVKKAGQEIAAQVLTVYEQAKQSAAEIPPEQFKKLTAEVRNSGGNLAGLDAKGILKTEGKAGKQALETAKERIEKRFKEDYLNSETMKGLRRGTVAYNDAALSFLLEKTEYSLLPPQEQLDFLKSKVIRIHPKAWVSPEDQLKELQSTRMDWVLRTSTQRLGQAVKLQAEQNRSRAVFFEEVSQENGNALLHYGFSARLYQSASQIDAGSVELKKEAAEAFALWGHKDPHPKNKAIHYRNALHNIDLVLAQDPQEWRAQKLQAEVLTAQGKTGAAVKSSAKAFQIFLQRFDETLLDFQGAATQSPVDAHRQLRSLQDQLKDSAGLPIVTGEQKLAILQRAQRYYQSAGDFSRQLEATPQGTFFAKDWGFKVQAKLSQNDNELRQLRGELNQFLALPAGAAISLEQLQAARLAYQVEVTLGDQQPQIGNLERWTQLLSRVSPQDISPAERLGHQTRIFKEWVRLGKFYAARQQHETAELPEALRKFSIPARMKSLAGEISRSEALGSAPSVRGAVLALLEQATASQDPRALQFIHPERLAPYASDFLNAQEKFSALNKIAEPTARRAALLHSLQEFARLRSPVKVQEAVKLLEATLPAEATHVDRLALISQIGQVLRGSGLPQEESNRAAGLNILKEFHDPKLPHSERAQGLLAAKNFFQAIDDKKAAEKNNRALRHLYVELRNDLLFHDSANKKGRLSDPQQRIEAAFLAQNIQVQLVAEDLSSAAPGGESPKLGATLLGGVQVVREEIAKAKELPLALRLEYLGRLNANLALLEPLSRGEKSSIQAQDFQKERQALTQDTQVLIRQEVASYEKKSPELSLEKRLEKFRELGEAAASLSKLNPSGQQELHDALAKSAWGLVEFQLNELVYGGTIAAGSAQETLAQQALTSFEQQARAALSRGDAAFFQQWSPPALTAFLKHHVDAGLLLADAEGKIAPEQIKRRLQAAALFAQAGLSDKVEETLAPAMLLARALEDSQGKGGALMAIATLLQSSGLVSRATAVFQEVSAFDQEKSSAALRQLGRLAKGILALNEGNPDQAKAQFKSISQHPLAQRYLATLEASEKLQRGLQGLQALSAVVNDLQQLIKEKGGRKDAAVSKELGFALDRARRQVASGNYLNFSEILKSSGLGNLLERNAHLLKSFVLEKGRNSWELTALYLKQIDNPKLSQKELARAGLQLAMAFLQSNRFGPAGEMAGLLQNDSTVGAEAKRIFDSLPKMQRNHALWTTLKNATVIGAEDSGEAFKNAALLLAGFGIGRVLALGAKAAYVAHTVRLAGAAPRAFQAGRWFVGAGAEGLGFSTVNTLGQFALFDKTEQLTAKHFMKEWGAMVVTFGLLHGMGGQVQALRAAAGDWGKKQAGKVILGAADYASRIGGFMIADVVNEYGTGLKDKQDIDIWMRLLNSAISDAHMIGAHKLGNKISRGKLDAATAREEIQARMAPALAKLKIAPDSPAGQALTAQLLQYSEHYQTGNRKILKSEDLAKQVAVADVRAQKILKAVKVSPEDSAYEGLRVLILKSHFEPDGKPITSPRGLKEALEKLGPKPEVVALSHLPAGQRGRTAQATTEFESDPNATVIPSVPTGKQMQRAGQDRPDETPAFAASRGKEPGALLAMEADSMTPLQKLAGELKEYFNAQTLADRPELLRDYTAAALESRAKVADELAQMSEAAGKSEKAEQHRAEAKLLRSAAQEADYLQVEARRLSTDFKSNLTPEQLRERAQELRDKAESVTKKGGDPTESLLAARAAELEAARREIAAEYPIETYTGDFLKLAAERLREDAAEHLRDDGSPEAIESAQKLRAQAEVLETLAELETTFAGENGMTRQALVQAVVKGKINLETAKRIATQEVAIQAIETETGLELNIVDYVNAVAPPTSPSAPKIKPANVEGPAPQRSQTSSPSEIQFLSLARHLSLEVTPHFAEELNAILPQIRTTPENIQRVYSFLEPYLQSVNALELSAVRREIFLQIAEGNIKFETAQNLSEQIIAGKLRLGLPEKGNSIPIFKVPASEQAEASKQAALNIAMGSTGFERSDRGTLSKLYRDLSENLELGILKAEDLLALAGIGLNPGDLMRLEDRLGPQSEWAFRLAEHPVNTAAILRNPRISKTAPVDATTAEAKPAAFEVPAELEVASLTRMERAALYQDFMADRAFVESRKNSAGETEYFLQDASGGHPRRVDRSVFDLYHDAATEKFLESRAEADREQEVQPEQIVEVIHLPSVEAKHDWNAMELAALKIGMSEGSAKVEEVEGSTGEPEYRLWINGKPHYEVGKKIHDLYQEVSAQEVSPEMVVGEKRVAWSDLEIIALKNDFKAGLAEVRKVISNGEEVFHLYSQDKFSLEVGKEIFDLFSEFSPAKAPLAPVISLGSRKSAQPSSESQAEPMRMAARTPEGKPIPREGDPKPAAADMAPAKPEGPLFSPGLREAGGIFLGMELFRNAMGEGGILIPVISGAIMALGSAHGYSRVIMNWVRAAFAKLMPFNRAEQAALSNDVSVKPQVETKGGSKNKTMKMEANPLDLDKQYPIASQLLPLPKAPKGTGKQDAELYSETRTILNRFAAKGGQPKPEAMRLEELSRLAEGSSTPASEALALIKNLKEQAACLTDPQMQSTAGELRKTLPGKVQKLKMLLEALAPLLQPKGLREFPKNLREKLMEDADFAADQLGWNGALKESQEIYNPTLVRARAIESLREGIPGLKRAIEQQEAKSKTVDTEGSREGERKISELYHLLQKSVQLVEGAKQYSSEWNAVQIAWERFQRPLFGMMIRLRAAERDSSSSVRLASDVPVRGLSEIIQGDYSGDLLAQGRHPTEFTANITVRNMEEAKQLSQNLRKIFLENPDFQAEDSASATRKMHENSVTLAFEGKAIFLKVTRPGGKTLILKLKIELEAKSKTASEAVRPQKKSMPPPEYSIKHLAARSQKKPVDDRKMEGDAAPEAESLEENTVKIKLGDIPGLREAGSLFVAAELGIGQALTDANILGPAIAVVALGAGLLLARKLLGRGPESELPVESKQAALSNQKGAKTAIPRSEVETRPVEGILKTGSENIPYLGSGNGDYTAELGRPRSPAKSSYNLLPIRESVVDPQHARLTLRSDGKTYLEDLSHAFPSPIKGAGHGTWVREWQGNELVWRKLDAGEAAALTPGQEFALGTVSSNSKRHVSGEPISEGEAHTDGALIFVLGKNGKILKYREKSLPELQALKSESPTVAPEAASTPAQIQGFLDVQEFRLEGMGPRQELENPFPLLSRPGDEVAISESKQGSRLEVEATDGAPILFLQRDAEGFRVVPAPGQEAKMGETVVPPEGMKLPEGRVILETEDHRYIFQVPKLAQGGVSGGSNFSSAASKMPQLLFPGGKKVEVPTLLQKGFLVLGREGDVAIGAGAVLQKLVSRRHATLSYKFESGENIFEIRDGAVTPDGKGWQASTQGTYVNGVRISSEAATRLQDGALIKIGGKEFRWSFPQ